MARLGLTSLPLVSLTRRVPGRTVNTLRDNILSCHYWFVEVFLLTHLKLCRQLEREKAAVWHFCGSGQQEEIFYSMAATIVRLEESGYRRSWREAFLFLPLSGVFRRATHHPSHGVTSILFSPQQACSVAFLNVHLLNHLSFEKKLRKRLEYSTTEERRGQRGESSLRNRPGSEVSHSASLHVVVEEPPGPTSSSSFVFLVVFCFPSRTTLRLHVWQRAFSDTTVHIYYW